MRTNSPVYDASVAARAGMVDTGAPVSPNHDAPATAKRSSLSLLRSVLSCFNGASKTLQDDDSEAIATSQRSSNAGAVGILRRVQAVTEFQYTSSKSPQRPVGSRAVDQNDVPFIAECLKNLFLFHIGDDQWSGTSPTTGTATSTTTTTSVAINRMITQGMYERSIPAGDILIAEGNTGMGASEMYVVKHGQFEVLQRRNGVNLRVNMKGPGDVFGEISLIYTQPRSATVCATKDSVVWVLDRKTFRGYMAEETRRSGGGSSNKQLTIELFMNQVQILAHMSFEDKVAFREAVWCCIAGLMV